MTYNGISVTLGILPGASNAFSISRHASERGAGQILVARSIMTSYPIRPELVDRLKTCLKR